MRPRLKVYIASSWKNAEMVRGFAGFLREEGYEVFDFTDGENRADGLDHFVFSTTEFIAKPREEIDWLEFLDEPVVKRTFNSDKAGIDWADALIMMLPCGSNAHLEAGYAAGQGKPVFIYGDLPKGQYEVMYHFAEGCYRELQLPALLSRLEAHERTARDLRLKDMFDEQRDVVPIPLTQDKFM